MCNFSCKFCNWIQNDKFGCRVHTCTATESDRNYISERENKKYCEFLCVEFDDACNDDDKKNLIRHFLNKQCPDSYFYIDEKYGIYCLESENGKINISIKIDGESLPEYINFIRVPGYFSISGRNLKTLRGCPRYVGLGFNCSFNKLETLEYAPEIVNFKEKDEDLTKWEGQKWDENVSFCCGNNLLTSLEGCPTVKKGSILCQMNKIKSFKGIQSDIKGSLLCSSNEISSFDYLPKISGYFCADENLFENIDEEKIKKVSGCKELNTWGCDRKINSRKITKEFIDKADNNFGKKYNFSETKLSSKSSQTIIICKRHNISFETYPQEFLNGNKQCPICRMEKYGFSTHDKKLYIERSRGQQDKEIHISPLCTDSVLIDKIIYFINNNITPNIYYAYFINNDYIIDIEPGYEYAWQGLNNPYKGISVFVENTLPPYIQFGEALVSSFNFVSEKWDFEKKKTIQYDKVLSIKGSPRKVFGDFVCKKQSLQSTEGSPEFVGGNFDVSNNEIKKFINFPKIVMGDVNLSHNELLSVNEFDKVDCDVYGNVNRKFNLFVE